MSHQFNEFDSVEHAPRWQSAPAPVIPPQPTAEQPASGRRALPIVLFLATCYTTYSVGQLDLQHGFMYSAALMSILLCHEMGHYLQARRYHVPASLPFFIPMPFGPLGTMGAVIGMRGNMGNRKALFDIGISGPLAGLVPTLVFSVLGLQWSTVGDIPKEPGHSLGDPLLFQFLTHWMFGQLPPNHDVYLHPLAYAGWVGVLITALNLLPIGQLDGGHILYAILRKKAHFVASAVLYAAIGAILVYGQYQWLPMLLLVVLFMGPNHPPTANDDGPLGTGRIILGWLTLAFVIIGFTPTPFS